MVVFCLPAQASNPTQSQAQAQVQAQIQAQAQACPGGLARIIYYL